jgi:N-methylhydantoinase A
MYSIGMDVGGTFTDVVVADEKNEIKVLKIPSTPRSPLDGIRAGLEAVAKAVGISVKDLVKKTDRLVHGTTVATNTMLQYSGAKTALFTTKGFRDSIEMRRCHRKGQWDFFTEQPPMIVPRRYRRGIKERTLWDGSIDQPLDEKHLLEEVKELVEKHGIEAISICFLFSFKKSTNERRAAQLIREHYPKVFVSASSDVAPQIREYERTSTTVVNAFVSPALSRYLEQLGGYLQSEGSTRDYQVIQSNGGITTSRAAGQNGVRALLSGPAGGAIGGVSLSERISEPNLIVADMGGTSFDVTLIQNGHISLVSEGEIAGYKVSLPMMDIHTVGAGGGSIGYVDAGGMLKVGPRSAGGQPGPVCYAMGGTEPTVTDADLVLGLINPDFFLGGSIHLDKQLALNAITEHVAKPLHISPVEAAQAMFEIVNANMVDALHLITVQKGHDPREFALVAAGGACPIHACVLAAALGMKRVVVPRTSEAFCAQGALEADMKYDYVRTCLLRMASLDPKELLGYFDELRQQGIERLRQDGISQDSWHFDYSLEMRYIGQHWQISVPLKLRDGQLPPMTEIMQAFHNRHEAVNGYKLEGREAEIVNIAVMAIGRSPKLQLRTWKEDGANAASAIKGKRRAYFGRPEFIEVPLYDSELLTSGRMFQGPAIIEKPNTTIVVGRDQRAHVDRYENIIIDLA